MAVIDDEGRLFGVVNVIDALVVLLVVALLVGSIGFVMSASNDESQATVSQRAVVTMEVPTHVASEITAGDNSTLRGEDGQVTFEEVWIGPGGIDSRVALFAVANLTVPASDTDREPFSVGETMRFQSTPPYNATVVSTGDSFDGFGERRHVLVRTNVSTEVANAVETGDKYRLAGRTVGEVVNVTAHPASANRRTLLVELNLTTRSTETERYFGSYRLSIGRTIPFETATYDLSPEVVAIGDEDGVSYGNRTQTTAVVKLDGVSQDTADSVVTGMNESSRGVTTATVVNKSVAPTTVTVTSSDGQLYARDHPTRKDVYLTVDLRTRQLESGVRFHGRPLRTDGSVTLDFGNATVTGRVIEIRD